jgi:D-alanyl-D-alanine carboxypeptidase (penicillin-binding protein 5/6)
MQARIVIITLFLELMRLIFTFLIFFLPHLSLAQQNTLPLPAVPPLAAKAYLLLDFRSGQPLAALNHNERFEPASLTKLMTAYLVFNALKQKTIKPDQVVPVSERAWRAEG